MKFAEYLEQGWNRHAKAPQEVAQGFREAVLKLETPDQIAPFAGLITHVMGEHLGDWSGGLDLLNGLRTHPLLPSDSEAKQSLVRSIAALKLAAGESVNLDSFSDSDRIRIFAVAASALVPRDLARSRRILHEAVREVDQSQLSASDPAYRALAITGNGLATELGEKAPRTAEETELMLYAASLARRFWELAGTWLQVERAEYRLSVSHLLAGQSSVALEHASLCLQMVEAHGEPPLEMFFALEAYARAEKACANGPGFIHTLARLQTYFDRLSEGDKSWCAATLAQLKTEPE